MKERRGIKRCLALLLALAMVISGLTIPERKATAAEETPVSNEATEVNDASVEGVVQIGDQGYATFAEALQVANDSETDVTIKLLDNISIGKEEAKITNTHNITITIDGNNKSYTMTTGQNAFMVQSNCCVRFVDMLINHTGNQATLKIESASTVEFENVKITANYNGFKWGLINTQASNAETECVTLNMDRVEVNMEVTVTATSGYGTYAMVRTDNTYNQKVAITMENCDLDASTAAKIKGVYIATNTSGTVNIIDTTIKTNDVQPIHNASSNATVDKKFNNQEDENKDEISCATTYVAQIGTTPFKSFTDSDDDPTNDALSVANTSGGTIELLADITLSLATTISNAITIDGNNHTITTTTTNNTIRITYAGNVNFENVILNHTASQSVIYINQVANVSLTDVTIKCQKDAYAYGLITTYYASGTDKIVLNLTNVDVTMDVTLANNSTSATNHSIIRTGNKDNAKTVEINITDCDLNASNQDYVRCVLIMQGTTATVNITNSTLASKNIEPIYDCNTEEEKIATITSTNAKLLVKDYAARIGDTLYEIFADADSTTDDAMAAAKTSEEAVTIELQKDITVGANNDIVNANGQNVTINGNGFTVTATGGNNTFRIGTPQAGTVEFKNMTIEQKNYGAAIQIRDNITAEQLEVNLTDVDIIANAPTNTTYGYEYALINLLADESTVTTLNLTRVDVTMATEYAGHGEDVAILRTGNGSTTAKPTNGTKTVYINLDECKWDTTEAAGRHGILVMDTTTANINLTNTKIKTADVAAIESNSTSEASQAIIMDDACELTSNVQEFADEPVSGYTAQVGNNYYMLFTDAISAANTAKEDAEFKLLKSVSIGAYVEVRNENGKKITFNGNGKHTISTKVSNTFRVYTDAEFINMTIDYTGNRSVIRTEAAVNVSLTDVVMRCTNSNYAYGLINTLGTTSGEEKVVLNLSNVDVTMNVTTNSTTVGTHAIIRTGNPTKTDDNQDKTVEINIKDGCDLNASTSLDVHDILILNGTTAFINIQDSALSTKNVVPIYDGNTEIPATIQKTNCTMNMADAVAQIGEEQYTDFASAVADANVSEEAVIIEVLKTIEIDTAVKINNEKGVDITINGNNNVINTNCNNAIRIQYVGNVVFNDMTINHTALQSAIRVEAVANVSLNHVPMNCSTEGYQYGLISTLTKTEGEAKVVLNLNDVDVTMTVTLGEDNATEPSVLRTGNDNQEKTVDINFTDCEWDASGASGVRGILVMNDTTANITMNNSKIITKDVEAIKATSSKSQTIVMDNACELTSENETISGYEAQVGNTVYLLFKDALTAVNTAEEASTIDLLSNVTVTYNYYIGNENGKSITINGNDKIITTAGSTYNHAFRVNKPSMVIFKDMTIKHNNRGSVVQVDENVAGATLTLTDVIIEAINPDNTYTNTTTNVTYEDIYSYALISLHSSSTLNMTGVNATMTVATDGLDEYLSIVRTGNVNQEKTVEINITDCNFNTTGASKRSGIIIMKTTDATLNVIDTNISTKDTGAIVDYSGNATIAKTFSEKDATKEGYTTYSSQDYVAQIGDTLYTEFATALADANESGDVTIELLQDVTVTSHNIGNKGKSIIIDGNNHKMTSAGEGYNHAFTVNKVGAVEFKNMTFVHNNRGAIVQTGETTAVGATVTLTDVVIQAVNPSNSYTSNEVTYENIYSYALINMMADSTLNLTRVDVTMDVDTASLGDGHSAAIIRTGNNNKDADKMVTMNLIDCNLDSTEAVGRSGILVFDAIVEINLVDTTIKTPNEEYCAAIQGYGTLTRKATISMRGNCLLESGSSTAASDTIKNLDGDSGITDGCVWTYKKYDNVTAFRTTNGLEAPSTVPTGYIFAGWYTDKSCAEEYALAETDTTTTSAYAKFVPDHVMEVKAQISANLLDGVSDGETGAIRFITTVDSLDYNEVGFEYTITNSGVELLKGTKKSNVVYRKLFAVGTKDGEALNYIPGFTFCGESEYFKAVTFKNVSSSLFDAEITVRPFWVTLDGTKVYGEAVTKTVNQGIENADEEGNVNSSESTESVYTNRVVLVSDMHYTTSLDKETYDSENYNWWNDKILKLPQPNASYAAGLAFGYTQEQKLQAILDDINGLGATKTIDSVMVLGDVTLDDYGYRNLVDNYLDDFKLNFMDKLTYPSYVIAGNHDSYTNDEWKNVIGTDRQYSVVIGDAVFIMLDTFEAAHATSASGSAYEGVDIDFLQTELAKEEYADKTIFLCSHYYQEGRNVENDAALKALIAGNDRIVCMFRGHTHKNTTITPDSLAGVTLIDIGGYAYNGQKEDDGTYDFNTFDKSWAWGYQVLEWNDEEVHLYHVKSARKYTDSNGDEHEYKGAIEDDIVIKLK